MATDDSKDDTDGESLAPELKSNYSFSVNGYFLSFSTGNYAFKVKTDDLTYCQFGTSVKELSYFKALSYRPPKDVYNTENLRIEVIRKVSDQNDKVYHLVSAQKERLWESGKVCQHYDLINTKFEHDGEETEDMLYHADTTLSIVAWPDSVTLNLKVVLHGHQRGQKFWSEGVTLRIQMKDWEIEKEFLPDDIPPNRAVTCSLHCNLNDNRDKMRSELNVNCKMTEPEQIMGTNFSDYFNCFLLAKDGLFQRSFKEGYTDIRDYDVFEIEVINDSNEDFYVPMLLFVQYLANPTGCVPMICDENFEPTGIHMQLSKNWHNKKMPKYGRFYFHLPVRANSSSKYFVRVAYGFYGSLPSASHANLSLIGYGGHGSRWEQLAIGCWGETFCMDVDMGCVPRVITDTRMLFTRDAVGKMWGWSDAGWGGDWLDTYHNDEKMKPYGWKTVYESHGPCLTDYKSDGWYMTNDMKIGIDVSSCVRSFRSDDHTRTLISLSYLFHSDFETSRCSFFSMGGAGDLYTPFVAYGCRDGLTEELRVDEDLEINTYFVERLELKGSPPWFVGFPGQELLDGKSWAKGFRALIIRKYLGIFNNKQYTNPSISLLSVNRTEQVKANLNLLLSPPSDVEMIRHGDSVIFEVEWITLPKKAADYYGPNEAFRSHLLQHPNSWRTIHQEAIQNDLQVGVSGGVLKCNYPVIIQATDESCVEVTFEELIAGNPNYSRVPIRFEGLRSRKFALYQMMQNGDEQRFSPEVHGNDYWQTDYEVNNGYSLSFNITLDASKPKWLLRKCEDKK